MIIHYSNRFADNKTKTFCDKDFSTLHIQLSNGVFAYFINEKDLTAYVSFISDKVNCSDCLNEFIIRDIIE